MTTRARRGGLLPLIAIALADCASGASGNRDSVPQSHDVQASDPSASHGDLQGYEYVARRPLALVALAEARGISPEVARRAVDQVADALDTCTTTRANGGSHVDGAARVVASIDDNGAVGTPSLRVQPGEGVAQSAIVCLVAPLRLLSFPTADAGGRGIAIEALWGHLVSAGAPAL